MFEIAQLIIVLLFGALIADGALTILILRRGGRELNPVMSVMIRRLGLKEAVLATRGLAVSLIAIFWVMNAMSFMIGLLISTVMIVCCGAYTLIKPWLVCRFCSA